MLVGVAANEPVRSVAGVKVVEEKGATTETCSEVYHLFLHQQAPLAEAAQRETEAAQREAGQAVG